MRPVIRISVLSITVLSISSACATAGPEQALEKYRPGAKVQGATYVLEDGSTVDLVLENGEWKVPSVSPGRFDTPERALDTFFRAALDGELSLVRRAIPERDRGPLATDEALSKHLADNADRIARAREKLGALTERRAQVRGERAELAYGPGLSVTFEKEGEGWVIVDLE